MKKVTRVPVDYDFIALNPEVMRRLARIAGYAAQKYGSWEQYTHGRLTGDKDPINHALAHLFDYLEGKKYERFDGGSDWNLIAAIYNLMMSFDAHHRWGPFQHPLTISEAHRRVRECAGQAPRRGSPVRRRGRRKKR